MVSLIKILTIITYFALATTNNIPTSRVLELSDKFLESYQEGQWLVMMYTPWCADCKKMESDWGSVAQYFQATSIRVGRVDCTRFTSVAQAFKIKGFPTIMFFKGDQQFVYNGNRTGDAIVQFAHRVSGPPLQEVMKTATLNNNTDHHIVANRNNLNETLYERVDGGRFPNFQRVTRGIVEDNELDELRSNCWNCSNCSNCSNCTNCSNSQNLSNCTNCRGCTNCSNCGNCDNCVNCSNCTNCRNCRNLSNVTGQTC